MPTGRGRDTVLRFAGVEVQKESKPTLRVTLHDDYYPLTVTLCYRAHEQHDLIERWAEITNAGNTPVNLERVLERALASALGPELSPLLSHRTLA